MGTKFRKDVGDLQPDFTANGSFRAVIAPPDGVIKRLDFYVRGTHTTDITTGQIEGAVNIFTNFQVTAPRKGGLKPITWNVLPRDLVWLTAILDGQRAPNANTAGTGLTHYDRFSIFLAPPNKRCETPDDWGLDTADLAGPIVIEGQYGAVTSIGTGSTAISSKCSVSVVYEDRKRNPDGTLATPFLVLAANQVRLAHESAGRKGPDQISVSNIEHLMAVMLRQHDNSAQAAQRVDGLITRYVLEHSAEGVLADEFAYSLQNASMAAMDLAAAEVPAGIALPVLSPRFTVGDAAYMGANTLNLMHDSAETVPDGVTDVTPAASDAVYAIAIGGMKSAAGVQAFRDAGLPA